MKLRSRDTVAKNSRTNVRVDVRFGSKADICSALAYVRFTLKSGHSVEEKSRSALIYLADDRALPAHGSAYCLLK